MAQIRNKTEHTLNIRVLNRSAEPDELVDVPDDIFKEHVWPETVWDVKATKSAKTKSEE